jgi:ABC-type branched-subunit amino acid transport system ATPase component/ABC-type branched-subunit amino acid transport system permease subunit
VTKSEAKVTEKDAAPWRSILASVHEPAVRLWRSPRIGLLIRVPTYTVGFLACVELVFGRDTIGHVPGVTAIPFPTGIGLGIIANGAVIGTLYALVAFGLILVYRANRVVNFAQAGLGALPALLGILLVTTGRLSYVPAFLLMLGGCVLTGVLAERVVLNPFRHRSRMIFTVATIGLAQLITLGEIYVPQLVTGDVFVSDQFTTPFSSASVTLGHVILTGDYFLIVVVAIVLAAALAAFFTFTRLGLAVRASADNAERAQLLGIPATRVSTTVWLIAAMLSGVAVFLRAPVVGVPLGTSLSPYVMLYALTIAVVARMQSLRTALFAGMAIGVIDQAAFAATSRADLSAALMLPILLAALLARRGVLSRAHDTGVSTFRMVEEFRRIPRELSGVREIRLVGLGLVAVVLSVLIAAPYLLGPQTGFASQILLYAMVGLSLVVLAGWAGQVSLGHFAFAGIGAAVAGGLAANHRMDFFVTLTVAALAGAAIAVLIGLPALRIPGMFLAVVTLAFAATVQNVLLQGDYMAWLLPRDGADIGRPLLWGRVDLESERAYYYVCLVVLVLTYASLWSLRRSRSGRVFISVRDNVRAAQSYGISSPRTRLSAFALSGAIAAVAGALLAYQAGAVSPDGYPLTISVDVFIFTVIGGLSSPLGAIAGAFLYLGLKYLGPGLGLNNLDTLGISGGVLFFLTFFPGGLAQAGYRIRDAYLRWTAHRHGLHVPSLLADDAVTGQPGNELDQRPDEPVHEQAPDDALLICQGLDVAYDKVQVLFGVDMHVQRGEVLALLGTNGAGKSTLLKAISGLVKPRAGTITYAGRDITTADAIVTTRNRIIHVPGGRGVFPTMTVAEHFKVAGWLDSRRSPEIRRTQAEVLSRFPQLAERLDQLAGDLSGGEQQQLTLGMAFLLRPELLIIDELTLGLSPVVVEQLLDAVRELNARGVTVILVEQSVNVALTLADRTYFMEKGEIRFEGPTRELLDRDDILRAVFLTGDAGSPAADPLPQAEPACDHTPAVRPRTGPLPDADHAEVLAIRGLSVSFGGIQAVDGVDLSVHDGQIVGLIGPNGAGKTTVFDLVSGFLTPTRGRVYLEERDVTRWSPDQRALAGLGRSFQDARIFASLTVAENIACAFERHLAFRDHLAAALGLPAVRELEEDVAWSTNDLIELMNLGTYHDKFVAELSTGTRRVVDLAMALAHNPRVLILDEPSSGIAQREAEALGPLLRQVCEETGCAMLIIEHDMPLIRTVSDHLVALDLGRVIAQGMPHEVVNDPRVITSYLGGREEAINRSSPDELPRTVAIGPVGSQPDQSGGSR